MRNTSKNVRNRMVRFVVGFYLDNNYGVDYDKLFSEFDVKDFLPYINRDFVELNNSLALDNNVLFSLSRSCKDLVWDWDNGIVDKRVWIEVRPMQNGDIDVCFKIEEK